MLRALVWVRDPEADVENLFSQIEDPGVSIVRVTHFSQVLAEINESPVDILYTLISPDDMQSLKEIEHLRRDLPDLVVVALFNFKEKPVSGRFPSNVVKIPAKKSDESFGEFINPDTPKKLQLTNFQRKVILLLMLGETYEQIAQILHLSEDALYLHLETIYDIFGVSSRSQAVKKIRAFIPELLDCEIGG